MLALLFACVCNSCMCVHACVICTLALFYCWCCLFFALLFVAGVVYCCCRHLCRVLCVICLSQENCVEATGQGIPQVQFFKTRIPLLRCIRSFACNYIYIYIYIYICIYKLQIHLKRCQFAVYLQLTPVSMQLFF